MSHKVQAAPDPAWRKHAVAACKWFLLRTELFASGGSVTEWAADVDSDAGIMEIGWVADLINVLNGDWTRARLQVWDPNGVYKNKEEVIMRVYGVRS